MVKASGAQGSRMRALRATPLIALLGLLGLLLAALAGSLGGPRPDHAVLAGYGSSSLESGSSPVSPQAQTPALFGSFRISGSVGGLYPGSSRPLVLTVKNLLPFKIVVTSITTKVQNATATCVAANLTVGAFSGHLAVPAFGSAKTSVSAGLVQSAPNACIGVTFPLSYHGLAQVGS